jgi:hypothetical protein
MPKKKSKSLKKEKIEPIKKSIIQKKKGLKKKAKNSRAGIRKKSRISNKVNENDSFMNKSDAADIIIMVGGLILITLLMISIS